MAATRGARRKKQPFDKLRVSGDGERACFVRQIVQQGNHRLLAGMGDVQPGEAKPFGRQQQFRQRADIDPKRRQVNQAIDQPQPLFRALPLMQGGGEGGADAGQDAVGRWNCSTQRARRRDGARNGN